MVYEVRLASADTQGELPEEEIRRYLTITERPFCLFLHKNLCCRCSLESLGEKKYVFQLSSKSIKNAPYLIEF